MRESVIAKISERKLVAIVRGIADKEQCQKTAQAICEGGIDLIEVTFNQSVPEQFCDTTDAIRAIREHLGDRVCVGAGTVLTSDQVRLAADAGAKYIISPNADKEVIRLTRELGLVSIPGVFTATEIVEAMDAGADFAKLFPAGLLGSTYIKALKAPLSHIKMLAVGGVDATNIPTFLKAGCDGFGIGATLANKTWIEAGEYGKITDVARELYNAVNQ